MRRRRRVYQTNPRCLPQFQESLRNRNQVKMRFVLKNQIPQHSSIGNGLFSSHSSLSTNICSGSNTKCKITMKNVFFKKKNMFSVLMSMEGCVSKNLDRDDFVINCEMDCNTEEVYHQHFMSPKIYVCQSV